MACRNKHCPHYCRISVSRNGCDLFPGVSLFKCRDFRP